MKKIYYYFYTTRKIISGGRSRYSNRVAKIFDFDTTKYRDDYNNYLNVIGDHLQDEKVEFHRLTITRITDE